MSGNVTLADPVDVIRYLYEEYWNESVFSPAPEVKAMFNRPLVRVENRDQNFIRPYMISWSEVSLDPRRRWKNETIVLSVNIASFDKETIMEVFDHAIDVLDKQRKNPNPKGQFRYKRLYQKPDASIMNYRGLYFERNIGIELRTIRYAGN